MLVSYLEKNYGYNEPIFINNIKIDGIKENALRQNFNRLLKKGFLKRFDTGVYYLPKPSGVLKNAYLDSNKVVQKKYISDDTNIFGYITGLSFANQLGLTTQNPAIIEIVTNKETSKGRKIDIGNKKIIIKKAKQTITNDNYRILQFLDLMSNYEKWAECNDSTVKNILLKFLRKEKLKRDFLYKYIGNYPGIVAKRLIETGLIYEFTL